MRERHHVQVAGVRDAIPGLNYHELALELFKTIDDASARIANAMPDVDPVAKAIESLEARLETMEDELRRINSALKELGPV